MNVRLLKAKRVEKNLRQIDLAKALNVTEKTLKKGKTLTLKIKTIKPADAVNQKVKWTSSNPKVAKVDKNGKVTAVGKGSCVITCTAQDGSKVKATVKIKVN